MKKITLLLLLFSCWLGYSQLNENFDSGMPATWTKISTVNGVVVTNQTQTWTLNTAPPGTYAAHTTPNAAYVNNENIGAGNTEEDWLITNQNLVQTNGQLRFFTRQTITGDQFTKYRIYFSTTSQTNLAGFTLLKEYTEPELTNLAGDITQYEEKAVDFPTAQFGQNVYIAFVRVFTQPTGLRAGDRWLIDDVRTVQKCVTPSNLTFTNIGSTTATLSWANPSLGTSFEIEAVLSTDNLTGTGIAITAPATNPTSVDLASAGIVLTPGAEYKIAIRALCAEAPSEQSPPAILPLLAVGSVCSGPIVVNALPYQTTDNTINYGDEVDTTQGTQCGAVPATTNYLQGNEVFYSYTAPANGTISIIMTPLGTPAGNSSLFVYNGCGTVGGTCIAGMANTAATPRALTLNVTANSTYIIVISSSAANQTIAYNLVIQNEICTPKPTNLNATNITTVSADLTWDAGTYSSWEVAVQPLGATIPSGSGTYVTSPTYGATLVAATQYQFYVRAECAPGSGTFTAWAGPFVFNSQICPESEKCTHIFRMTDSANNGWNGARMEIRQSGIVVATIGATYTSGAGPVDISVPLCNNLPFELYWSVAGTAPQQCIVAIINSFGQTIYTKAAGSGVAGSSLYNNVVNCTTPRCDLPVTNITFTNITTVGATINWVAPATTSWDVYIAPAGGPAPDLNTVPTYDNITDNPFPTINALLADTTYEVCVRVNCSPDPSTWTCSTFTTLPTCPKPTNLQVPQAGITTTSATLTWVNGTPTDNSWEVLLVPSLSMTPPTQLPPLNPTTGNGTLLIPTTSGSPMVLPAGTLTQATIYFYYVRTVCPGNDKSTWSGPIVFNTITCDAADKCNYKFVLTAATGNSWNGARMQIRQNGILIQTIGATAINSAAGVSVALCNNIPFDIFWSVAGTAQDNVGLSIQNPFTDIIFTKPPGTGTPLEVIYASVTNCTPPTCPKPTALNVVSVTQNSAELSWTEMGSATQWEVYAVPAGPTAVPPVNGSPVTGVAPYYIVTSNTAAIINGLLPGTTYVYYVRALCSSSDVSTWTILNPKNFTTKPLNDECDFATPVPVNPTRTCALSVNGSTLGATRSLPNTAPTCPGNTDDDVWFSFVATSNIHIITFSNIIGTTTDINHTLYSGVDCATQTQLYCSNPNVSIANNLQIGMMYRIRVYTNGGVATQSAAFTLCITTPPPITNDECAVAINVPVNNGLECVTSTPGSVTGATASANPSTCAGTEDDDVWFDFIANSPTQIISFNNIQGTSTNLVHSLFHGDNCGTMTQVYCNSTDESTANNLIVGDHYKIRVWSNENTLQDITFEICIGKILPPITANTTQYTKQQLIEDILLNSSCASVSDITFSTGTNFGSTNGIGYFNKAQSEFGFEDGVVLSTGNAANVPGPNLTTLGEGVNAWPGDADLEAIVPMESHNATILEFNFIPLQDHIQFRYKFASEEYGTFQCSYSDAFAFILTNNTTGVSNNLAIVPDSNPPVPVAVTTVRDQLFNTGCDSQNPDKFDTFYGNLGVNPIGAPINFNGVTDTFTAYSPVTVGTQYHIKLVIADRGDTAYDSAVFLEGGSFDIGNVELGSDFLQSAGNAICYGDTVTLNSQLDPATYTFKWEKDGVEIVGETNPTLEITAPGVYTIKAQFINTTCLATDSITVEFFEDVPAGTPNTLTKCDSTGTAVFDLTQNDTPILAPFPASSHTTVYFLTQDDADNNIIANAIPDPTNFVGNDGQIIYVRVNKNATSCHQVVSFALVVQDLTPQYTLTGTTAICPNETTSISVVPTDNNFDPTLVSYIWSYNATPLPDTGSSLSITGANYGTYTVTVNNSGCTAMQTFEITNSNVTWDFTVAAPASLCPNETGTLAVTVLNNTNNEPVTYTFTRPDATTVTGPANTFAVAAGATGDYIVSVDILGCVSTQTITIAPSTNAWDFTVAAPASLCPNETGTLSVTVLNNTNNEPVTYTFTRPDATTVTGPANTFAVAAGATGDYIVSVDILGCVSTQTIAIAPSTNAWDFTVTGPQALCPNETGTITVNILNNISGAPVTYTYTLPDSSTVVSSSNTFAIAAGAVGNYTVTVDIFGCTTSQVYTISPSTSNWTGTFTGPSELCPQGTGVLTVTVTNNTNGSPITYNYTRPDGSTVVSTSNTLAVNGTQLGTYGVSINILGCENALAPFTINAGTGNWDISFVGAPYTICANQSTDIAFTANNFNLNDPDAVYTWTRPDGSQVGGAVLSANQVGAYTLEVDILGCTKTFTTSVTQNTNSIAIDVTAGCESNDYVLKATVSNPADVVSYVWTGPAFTAGATPDEIIATAIGTYEVAITTTDGCVSTQDFSPTDVACDVQKGISPNNDGKNDSFDLSTLNVKLLTIYNRYGTEVYQLKNYSDQWHGQSAGGMELPDATYFYVIEKQDGKKETGWIYINR